MMEGDPQAGSQPGPLPPPADPPPPPTATPTAPVPPEPPAPPEPRLTKAERRELEKRAARELARRQARKQRWTVGASVGGGSIAILAVLAFVLAGSGGGAVQAAPAWAARSIDGQAFSSESLEGDVYVVDFFFTWCPICAKQLPHKKALVEAFEDRKDFHFISVSADPNDSPSVLNNYRTRNGATWPFVQDSYGLYQKFKVDSRPFLVFVGRDGHIEEIFRSITPARDLITMAQRLLDEPPPNATSPAPAPTNETTVPSSTPPAAPASDVLQTEAHSGRPGDVWPRDGLRRLPFAIEYLRRG